MAADHGGINSIMVMTRYNQQERMLLLCLQHHHDQGIRIDTVDKFQGQEDKVTIISMVRSNNKLDYHEAISFVTYCCSCYIVNHEVKCILYVKRNWLNIQSSKTKYVK